MNGKQDNSSLSAVREFVIDWLRKELVWPAPGYPMVQLNREEILRPQDPPRYRYGCGILFPLGVRYSGGDPVEPEEVEGIRIANKIDPANGSAGADDGQEQGAEPASDGTTVEPEPEVNATVQPGTKQLE